MFRKRDIAVLILLLAQSAYSDSVTWNDIEYRDVYITSSTNSLYIRIPETGQIVNAMKSESSNLKISEDTDVRNELREMWKTKHDALISEQIKRDHEKASPSDYEEYVRDEQAAQLVTPEYKELRLTGNRRSSPYTRQLIQSNLAAIRARSQGQGPVNGPSNRSGGGTTGGASGGRGGGGGGGSNGGGGGQVGGFSNISDLFSTIDDQSVGERSSSSLDVLFR